MYRPTHKLLILAVLVTCVYRSVCLASNLSFFAFLLELLLLYFDLPPFLLNLEKYHQNLFLASAQLQRAFRGGRNRPVS